MKKVLFIQNSLLHYRIPLYEYLQNNYGHITVCHIDKPNLKDSKVTEICLDYRSFKGFVFQKKLHRLVRDYDIIVGMFDLRWPLIWSLPFFLRKNQVFLLWGIGVSTNQGFDVNKKMDFIRFSVAKLADGLLFYSNYPLQKYIDHNFNPAKLFVCPNTIYNDRKIRIGNRRLEKILFIGRLNKRKGIKTLIDAYFSIGKLFNYRIPLEIVGSGSELQNLKLYVSQLGLDNHVYFKGAIYESEKKRKIFANAICTVSPNQAGLAVLESFSYGVPFITSKNAITGGERLNIIHGETGFFADGENELANVLLKLIKDPDLCRVISGNCLDHYWNKRQMKEMGNGFIDAFNKITQQKLYHSNSEK